MLRDWRHALVVWGDDGEAHCLVTVAEALGSTPREGGAKMVVSATTVVDSIGGGVLELEAIATARALLAKGAISPVSEKIMLGADREQCCGGACTLLFEPFPATAHQLVIFGAGHVAHALVRVLDGTRWRVTCFDERADFLTQPFAGRVTTRLAPDPVTEVDPLPAEAVTVVMTHSHERDFALICALLKRDNHRPIGLIGSKTKAARFRRRLIESGFSAEETTRVLCPVGLPKVGGKRPADIAIAIAAWLLQTETS